MVGLHEDPVAGDAHAAIVAGRAGVADEARGEGLRVFPETGAGTGVEGDDGVGIRHIHYAFVDLRSTLEAAGVRHGEDPFDGHFGDVILVYLVEGGIAVAAELAVHAGPIGLRGDLAVLLAGLAEKVNFLVVGAELQFAAGAGDGKAFEGSAVGEGRGDADGRTGAPAAGLLQGAHEGDEAGHFGGGKLFEGGHSFTGDAVADDLAEFLVVLDGQRGEDCGGVFTAIAIGTVAAGAAVLEGGTAVGGLGQGEQCRKN